MSDNRNENLGRWQALDMIKTVGLLGALSGHILVWWFGKNWGPANSATFFSLNGIPNWLATVLLIMVNFILISAGASFYFYLKKYKPTFKKIAFRIALFILLGVLFGLNLHPPFLAWTIFLFYALSILIIFILDRWGNEKFIIYLTLGVLALTPLMRLFLNKIAPENYLSAVLTGAPMGGHSFYPFFPWFFLIGSGFLISYFYSKYQSKRFLLYGALGGIIISIISIPFLKPLDFSGVFGVTSQISIFYIIFTFSSFIFLISSLELILKNITLSKYNPVIMGRHILPVYLITFFVTLLLTNAFKNSTKYDNSIYIFLSLELATFLIAYLTGVILTYTSRQQRRKND